MAGPERMRSWSLPAFWKTFVRGALLDVHHLQVIGLDGHMVVMVKELHSLEFVRFLLLSEHVTKLSRTFQALLHICIIRNGLLREGRSGCQ